MATMNIYNYYHAAMPQIANTKYDSHKKSELRALYKDMVRLNKSKPYYKLSLSDATQAYVIGIKDAAIELKNSASFLTEDVSSDTQKLTVQTDTPQELGVQLLADASDASPADIRLQVDQLASPQINEGNYLLSNGTGISAGVHYINIRTAGNEYQFEIETKRGETNLQIQERLAMSINNSNIGINANIDQQDSSSALVLESTASGLGSLDNGLQFSISGSTPRGLVYTLGLTRMTTAPADAGFTLNGVPRTSASNHISINNHIGIELKQATGIEHTVSVVPDRSAILDDVDDFIHYYNHLVDLAQNTEGNPSGSRKLLRDLNGITRHFHNSLEASGLLLSEDGHITKDEGLLTQSTENGQFQELFRQLSDFKSAIQSATDRMTLNPMEYVDKTIISYPNTRRNFPNPYMPSIYSGMLYNRYV